MIKTVLSFFLCAISLQAAVAQDVIYKKNGDSLRVTVIGGNSRFLQYKVTPDGDRYDILKKSLRKVVYHDGNIENFGHDDRPATTYGRNIIAVAPLQFTENGIGGSLSYEGILDKEGYIGIYLPVVFTVNEKNEGGYNYATGNSTTHINNDGMYYFMPALKFYPTSSNAVVKYAIGPQFDFGVGQKANVLGYDNYGNPIVQQQTHALVGIMVLNAVDINATKHCFVGLDYAMGATYSDRLDGVNQGIKFILQTGFRLGYRF
jgi:hypothetical protein